MSLISDITTFKAIIPQIDVQADFNKTYAPYLNDAEDIYILPVIGQEMYDSISGEVANELATAKAKIQRALAYYAVYDMSDFLNLNITGNGIKESSTENTTQSRQWVLNQGKKAALHKADQLLDMALKYMEDNKASFAAWVGSDAYTEFTDLFIHTAGEYNKFVRIQDSRRTFVRLVPFMEDIENSLIKKTIGDNLFDVLKTEDAAGTLSEANLILVKLIKEAVANMAMAQGALDMPMNFEASGIKVVSTDDGITRKQDAGDKQLMAYVQMRKNLGEQKLHDLKNYLIANAASYPDFEGSDAETNDFPTPVIHDNSNKKSFMV
uniref:DUF6712 family protein n=1 Tax=Roseivirga sp. TaxID=1964215 RepID=UPI004048B10A